LAQRQGLLYGRHLSMVQAKGSIIMDWIEQLASARKAVKADLLRVQSALVASGSYRPEKVFADYFPDDVDTDMPENLDVEAPDGSKLGVDYSEVEWQSGDKAREEYEELMRSIGALSQGSMTGTDFSNPSPNDGWI
jgi:hypothetical protein